MQSADSTHQLSISVFGSPQVLLDGEPVTEWASRKTLALFVYLALDPRRHQREQIAPLFFDTNTSTRALANLSVLLSHIRKQLGAHFVSADRHTIQLASDQPIEVDARLLEESVDTFDLIGKRLTRTQLTRLQTLVDRYEEVLAGFYVRGAAQFEEWLALERQHYREVAARALGLLIDGYTERKRTGDALAAVRRLIALDPLRESAHRTQMQLLAMQGERTAALAQFETLQSLLWDELGVEPEDTTLRLHEQLAREGRGGLAMAREPKARRNHNLPAETSAFFGRISELQQIDQHLTHPNCRLLTLVGQGGSGKTRLAITTARQCSDRYLDGVWLVSLADITRTPDVIAAIAAAVGMQLQGDPSPEQQLQAWLSQRELLLILDNVEQLVDVGTPELIAAILQNAPDVQIVVTSRERLQLKAEWLIEVGGLAYPATRDEATGAFPAIALFEEQARRLDADYRVSAENLPHLVQLCRLVDGLPLALELAASWTRSLPLPTIVSEVERGIDILSTQLRDLPARHRSIRAMIETTWQQLSDDERTAYRKLAIFRDGFTREAAAAVARADARLLTRLMDRSLLIRDAQDRYRRHPLLAQFAVEQLVQDTALHNTIAQRHARYFAAYLNRQRQAMERADKPQLARLRLEATNIRVAWQWVIAQRDRKLIATTWRSIYLFMLDVVSRYAEGVEQFQNGLACLSHPTDDQLIAALLSRIGWFQLELNQLDAARAALTRSLELTQKHDDFELQAWLGARLPIVLLWQGELDEARRLLDSTEKIARTHPDAAVELPVILTHSGIVFDQAGATERALQPLQEALSLARAANQITTAEVALSNLGSMYHQLKQWELARSHFEEALAIGRQYGNLRSTAISLHNLAEVNAELSTFATARTYAQQAHRRFQDTQQPHYATMSLSLLAEIERRDRRLITARRYHQAALRLAATLHVVWIQLHALEQYTRLLIDEQRSEEALERLLFIVDQQATQVQTRQSADASLKKLRGVISAERQTQMQQRAKHQTLSAFLSTTP